MTHLQKIISDLCPNGVPMIKLGELEDAKVLKLGRGDVISKTDLNDVPGSFPVYSSSAVSNGLFGRYGKFMFDDERITWSIDGGGKFFYRPIHQYSVTNVCGWLKVLEPKFLITKYVYYVLSAAWGGRTYNYTVKAHPSVIREDYLIPLPPIEVQQEIVRLLDLFKELEAELDAELVARKTQFEHYRRKLFLTYPSSKNFEMIEMKNICKRFSGLPLTAGKMRELDNKMGDVRIFAGGQTVANVLSSEIDNDFIEGPGLIVKSRGIIDFEYWEGRYNHKSELWSYKPISGSVNLKYVYHFLKTQTNFVRQIAKANSVAMPQIKVGDIDLMQIPLPSLQIQNEIAEALNYFETIVEDKTYGLPAEILKRSQQFEYFRNRLLTFKPLEVA